MSYVLPGDVTSPKAMWALVDVVLDRGPRNCAYAIGMWDKKRRVGFRWNGSEENPIGNPQSRGLPTWTMLDPELYGAVLHQVEKNNPDKANIMRAFLGIGLAQTGAKSA